jgi:hypothetical protein
MSKKRQFASLRYRVKVNESSAQLDQIISGKLESDKPENLRTLCQHCRLLESDHRHRKIIDMP